MTNKEGCLRLAGAAGVLAALAACATRSVGDLPVTHSGCRDSTIQAKAAAAKSLVDDKRYDDATHSARAVLDKCEAEPMATAALGEALVAKKDYREAAEAMTKALTANKDLAAAHLWRGYAHYYLGSHEGMVADFDRFLSLEPGAPEGEGVSQLLASRR